MSKTTNVMFLSFLKVVITSQLDVIGENSVVISAVEVVLERAP